MKQLTPTQNKMLAWEMFEHGVAPAVLGRRRRLGDVCVVTAGGSRVCSADATSIQGSLANTNLNLNPGIPMNIPSFFQHGGFSAVSTLLPQGGVPTVASALALAQAIYNSNPANLTQNQWALLQSAGVIPSTLPYSSAAQLPASQSTAATAAATPATTDIMLGTFDLTQFVASIPWWGYALGAGGLLFLFSGSQKRGRR